MIDIVNSIQYIKIIIILTVSICLKKAQAANNNTLPKDTQAICRSIWTNTFFTSILLYSILLLYPANIEKLPVFTPLEKYKCKNNWINTPIIIISTTISTTRWSVRLPIIKYKKMVVAVAAKRYPDVFGNTTSFSFVPSKNSSNVTSNTAESFCNI